MKHHVERGHMEPAISILIPYIWGRLFQTFPPTSGNCTSSPDNTWNRDSGQENLCGGIRYLSLDHIGYMGNPACFVRSVKHPWNGGSFKMQTRTLISTSDMPVSGISVECLQLLLQNKLPFFISISTFLWIGWLMTVKNKNPTAFCCWKHYHLAAESSCWFQLSFGNMNARLCTSDSLKYLSLHQIFRQLEWP